MAKTKTMYVCSSCGADSPKWVGKCPSCGEWNTYVEEIVMKDPVAKRSIPGITESTKARPVLCVTLLPTKKHGLIWVTKN